MRIPRWVRLMSRLPSTRACSASIRTTLWRTIILLSHTNEKVSESWPRRNTNIFWKPGIRPIRTSRKSLLRGRTSVRSQLSRRLCARPRRLRQTNQIRHQPIGAWHSFGQLSEPAVRRVDVQPFAIFGYDFPALQVRFARIVTSHQRFEVRVPISQKVSPALLYPSIEISLSD